MSQDILPEKMPLWFGFNPFKNRRNTPEEQATLDELCRSRFGEAVRACGRGDFDHNPAWTTPDGLFARMLLTDQFSRNAFRGTAEAFAFDQQAVRYAREIYERGLYKGYGRIHYIFLCTPGSHSEHLADHERNMHLVNYAEATSGGVGERIKFFLAEHMEVIERFGRFPHRNAELGRQSTPDEVAWLSDVKNLPAWAKSKL